MSTLSEKAEKGKNGRGGVITLLLLLKKGILHKNYLNLKSYIFMYFLCILAYIYPDFLTALVGNFDDQILIKAQEVNY